MIDYFEGEYPNGIQFAFELSGQALMRCKLCLYYSYIKLNRQQIYEHLKALLKNNLKNYLVAKTNDTSIVYIFLHEKISILDKSRFNLIDFDTNKEITCSYSAVCNPYTFLTYCRESDKNFLSNLPLDYNVKIVNKKNGDPVIMQGMLDFLSRNRPDMIVVTYNSMSANIKCLHKHPYYDFSSYAIHEEDQNTSKFFLFPSSFLNWFKNEMGQKDKRVLLMIATTGSTKTEGIVYILKSSGYNPLLVKRLKDLKKFDVEWHDSIIFEDLDSLNFNNYHESNFLDERIVDQPRILFGELENDQASIGNFEIVAKNRLKPFLDKYISSRLIKRILSNTLKREISIKKLEKAMRKSIQIFDAFHRNLEF